LKSRPQRETCTANGGNWRKWLRSPGLAGEKGESERSVKGGILLGYLVFFEAVDQLLLFILVCPLLTAAAALLVSPLKITVEKWDSLNRVFSDLFKVLTGSSALYSRPLQGSPLCI